MSADSFPKSAEESAWSVLETEHGSTHLAVRQRNGAFAPTSQIRVLCIDDEVDIADSEVELLRMHGMKARACYEGSSALSAAEEFRPDLCFLDLMMPGINGLEVAARLKARAKADPLLLVATTALGSLDSRIQTALVGFHAHLVKPVVASVLVATVRRFEAMTLGTDNSRDSFKTVAGLYG